MKPENLANTGSVEEEVKNKGRQRIRDVTGGESSSVEVPLSSEVESLGQSSKMATKWSTWGKGKGKKKGKTKMKSHFAKQYPVVTLALASVNVKSILSMSKWAGTEAFLTPRYKQISCACRRVAYWGERNLYFLRRGGLEDLHNGWAVMKTEHLE